MMEENNVKEQIYLFVFEDGSTYEMNCGIPGIEITSMDYDLHDEIVNGILGLKMDIKNE